MNHLNKIFLLNLKCEILEIYKINLRQRLLQNTALPILN